MDDVRKLEVENHDMVPLEHYLKEYAAEEPTHIANRLGIAFDYFSESFNIQFLGKQYDVTHPGLEIASVEGEDTFGIVENVNFKILVVRYLLYSTVFPQNGDFMSFGQLPSGAVYERQFEQRCNQRFAARYGKNPDLFRHVCDVLEAMPIHAADVAYELEFLDGLSIRFLIWKGDEEFEASSQILFSSNFPAAFATYDLAEIMDLCLKVFGRLEA